MEEPARVSYRKNRKSTYKKVVVLVMLEITLLFSIIGYLTYHVQARETTVHTPKVENLMLESSQVFMMQHETRDQEIFRFATIEAEKALFSEDVYIYEEMNTNSRVVGRGYRDGFCAVLKKIDNWFYIESGQVRGFVEQKLLRGEDAIIRVQELSEQEQGRVKIDLNINQENELIPNALAEQEHFYLRGADPYMVPAENRAFSYTKTTTKPTIIEKQYLIAKQDIEILEGKKPYARVVGTLVEDGVAFLVIDEKDGWYYIESQDVRGFIKEEEVHSIEESLVLIQNVTEHVFANEKINPLENQSFYYSLLSVEKGKAENVVRESMTTYLQYFMEKEIEEVNEKMESIDSASVFFAKMYGEYGYTISEDIQEQAQSMEEIPTNQIRVGDLIYYGENETISDVVMYIGSNKVVEIDLAENLLYIRDIDRGKIIFGIDIISQNGEITEEKALQKAEAVYKGEVAQKSTQSNSSTQSQLQNQTVSQTSSDNQTNSENQGNYLGTFKLTAYCRCEICCGQWSGGPTASGVMPQVGRTVAMGGIEFGTRLLINGHVYIVEDRGTPYGHIDIFMEIHQEAIEFGVQHADIYLVE